MRLKAKIQSLFAVVIIITLSIVTLSSYKMNTSSSLDILAENLTTSSSIASDYLAQHLQDYLHLVTSIGQSELLTNNASSEAKLEYVNAYVDTLGLTSANILDLNGVSLKDGTDFSDREYVKKALKGNSNLSELTLSRYTNTYGFSIAAPIIDSADSITGVVYFRMDMHYLQSVMDSFETTENSYSYIVNKDGVVITHPVNDLVQTYNLTEQTNGLEKIAQKLANGESGNGEYEYEGTSLKCGFSPIANTDGWGLIIVTPTDSIMKTAHDNANTQIMIALIACIVALIISAVFSNYISHPIIKIQKALLSISEGDLSVKIPTMNRKDEIGILHNAAASLIDTLSKIIGQTNQVLEKMALYDMTADVMNAYPGDFNTLSSSVNRIKGILNDLIVQVEESVANVDTGSRQLTMAAEALSTGTLTQANSIQILEEHLNDIVAGTNRNSQNEEIVNEKLITLDQQIRNSNEQMLTLLKVVKEIENMSEDIQKIVGTIDSIAFQTNILSLNASVEASRAGEMGRGFAVVAEEVRSLAEKCSESSKKTEELIDKCITAITNAKTYADNTVDSLSVIVTGSAEIATAFENISESTKEQALKSNQIQYEIHNISDVVQSNTATAEETAASSEVLSEQANTLHELIQQFKIRKY